MLVQFVTDLTESNHVANSRYSLGGESVHRAPVDVDDARRWKRPATDERRPGKTASS